MTDQIPGKPFDLEAARRGEPFFVLINDIEHKVLEWHRFENLLEDRHIYVVSGPEKYLQTFDDKGMCRYSDFMLRMAPKKRTVWVAFFVGSYGDVYCDQYTYATEADARIKHPEGLWSIFPHEITE